MTALLEVVDLVTEFRTERGRLRAVDGASLAIAAGKTLAVVGESGSGKSVTALSIMRLITDPPGRIVSGQIRFDGRDLLGMPERELRDIRGNRISMIFQEPMTSLNPVLTCGEQVAEAIRLHEGKSRAEAQTRTIELFRLVGIPAAEERIRAYPHQMSGGMRQRVMIAMALACGPSLLIADEPTTALDVTIQAQILELLSRLQRELGMAILLITHDLGVVAETCEDVVVMYAGQVVESGRTADVLAHPQHHYTAGLLRSRIPDEPDPEAPARPRLPVIRDPLVPEGRTQGQGCRFAARCDVAQDPCWDTPPLLGTAPGAGAGHEVRCHFPLARQVAA